MSRQDHGTIDGDPILITSGSAPAGTTAVTAVSQDGTPLTATLVRPKFMHEVVFVMRSEKHSITHLKFTLADGESGQESSVSTP